jgi:hypothetical protein
MAQSGSRWATVQIGPLNARRGFICTQIIAMRVAQDFASILQTFGSLND